MYGKNMNVFIDRRVLCIKQHTNSLVRLMKRFFQAVQSSYFRCSLTHCTFTQCLICIVVVFRSFQETANILVEVFICICSCIFSPLINHILTTYKLNQKCSKKMIRVICLELYVMSSHSLMPFSKSC